MLMGRVEAPFAPRIEASLQSKSDELKSRTLGYRAIQVVLFVQDHIAIHGHSPSYRVIRDHLGFTDKSDVQKVCKRLEKRGLIAIIGNPERNWHLPAIQLL